VEGDRVCFTVGDEDLEGRVERFERCSELKNSQLVVDNDFERTEI
jgi:hypothetical protein